SYPMVTRVEPAAVQRGTSAELMIAGGGNGGGGFSGGFNLVVQPPGLRGGGVKAGPRGPVPPQAHGQGRGGRRGQGRVKARLDVAKDAPLGPRELRVGTPQGVSSVGLVVVVDDPVVTETDDRANDNPKGAQPLALPCVVSGSVGKVEDVDWYAVEAK